MSYPNSPPPYSEIKTDPTVAITAQPTPAANAAGQPLPQVASYTPAAYYQPPPPVMQPVPQPLYAQPPPPAQQTVIITTTTRPGVPLGSCSTHVTCPSCHAAVLTKVTHQPNPRTHCWALMLCLFGCWPCVCLPYCMESCKSANHYCPNCSAYIGTFEN